MALFDDTTRYIRIPTRTAAGCLSLARALIVAAPQAGPAVLNARLASIHDAASELQSAWIRATQADDSDRPRTYDRRVDRGWSILLDRLGHWVEIEHPSKAEAAEALLAKLFPTGLDFISLAYTEQWAESEKRLAMVESEGLEDELAKLVDPAFVEHLGEAHRDYGDVLGITAKKPEPEPAQVMTSIRSLRAAMADYAMLVIGLSDRKDADAVAKAEAWLEPIPRFRVARGTPEASTEAPDEPLPPLPSGE